MAREREKRPARKMKPIYIVFCEGETEENYVSTLRMMYRVPVKIVSKITGQKISHSLIERHERAERITINDVVTSFIMYDLDVSVIANHLVKCNAISLTSNPCIELWFLLHEHDQRAEISTDTCVKKLVQISPDWSSYEKGTLSERQKKILFTKVSVACKRAKQLNTPSNPSTTVYRLIEKLIDANTISIEK